MRLLELEIQRPQQVALVSDQKSSLPHHTETVPLQTSYHYFLPSGLTIVEVSLIVETNRDHFKHLPIEMRPPESVSSLVHEDCVDPVFKYSFLLFELFLPRNLSKG